MSEASSAKKVVHRSTGKKASAGARQEMRSSVERSLAQREAELSLINSIQVGLASKLGMQEIYELVGDKIREIFNAPNVTFGIRDRVNNLATFPYAVVEGERVHPGPFPPDPMGLYLEKNCEPLLVKRASDWQKYGLDDNRARSFLAVPLRVGGEFMGAISISNNEIENAFSESDVRLLATMVNSMSVALENARLFDETQQRNSELAIINSVQEGLVTHLDFNSIIHLVGGKLGEIFKVSTIQINIYDRAQSLMHIPYCFEEGSLHTHEDVDLNAPHWFISHMKQIIETRQTVVINENTLGVARQRGGPTEPPRGARWSLCMVGVPLIAKDEAIGIIWLMDNDRENVFTGPMVRLLQTLANSMSVALENARLWEQEKMYRKALQRELDIGREIQQGFLPESLPHVEGWEIVASLMSAREVAGDFYDAFELPDGTLGLVIADVCDKGVGAALFMTLFRSLIRAVANLDYFEHTEKVDVPRTSAGRLQRAVSLTNNYIAETHSESGMFATLFFGILDPHNGKLVYINGGHETPLILHSGASLESLQKTGPAVGAIPNCLFQLGETHMSSGDMFLAFTDGVPDGKNLREQFFGRDRVIDIFRNARGSAQELVESLASDLHEFTAGATQFDDITLLALRRT
jgi:sigma-B regulation protein RsbU (phosphoserine phosphatase)